MRFITRWIGRILCSAGKHKWKRYSVAWGARHIWMVECTREDCRARYVE